MKNEILVIADNIVALSQDSGRAAGEMLEDVAAKDGDAKMLAVMSELDIMSVAKIVRDHDTTIPSIATWLMEPQIIKDLLDVEPAYWQNEIEKSAWTARDGAMSLLSQIFLSNDDDERQAEILRVIGAESSGLLYLSLPFVGFDFDAIDTEEEQVSGSEAELIERIKLLDATVYADIVEMCKNGDCDAIERELIQQANSLKIGELDDDIDDMFAPL